MIRLGGILLNTSTIQYHYFTFINLLDDFAIGDNLDLVGMDDSLLVLTYGRDISDNKLIERHNTKWRGFSNIPPLKYKDFEGFLNL